MLNRAFSQSGPASELDAILAAAGRHQRADYTALFGAELAAAVGFGHGLPVSSDTAAVSTLIGALGLRPGDPVLVAAHLRTRFVFPLLFEGLVPVFVDCLRADLTLDPAALTAALGTAAEGARAAFLAAPWGVLPAMGPIRDALAPKGCRIVLDVTDALVPGLAELGLAAGADVALVSLTEGDSPLSTGEGGAILSDDAPLIAEAESYQRFADLAGKRLGINQKISAMQAALGLHRLTRLPDTDAKATALRRRFGPAVAGDIQGAALGTYLILRRADDLPDAPLRHLPRAHRLAAAADHARDCPRLDRVAAALRALPLYQTERPDV